MHHYVKKIIKSLIKKITNIPMESAWRGGLYKEYNNKDIQDDYKTLLAGHGNELGLEICQVYGNKNGIVTITSDDGDYHTALQFDKLSKMYSIPVTISAPVYKVYPRIKEWKKLLENRHLELVNHSYNHYRMDENWKHARNEKKLIHELIHSQLFFNKYFYVPQYLFVCPENIICNMGLDILKKHGVIAMRGYGPGYNSLIIEDGSNNGQWLNLNSLTIIDIPREEGKDLRKMRNQWLLEAASGKWLIEQWHNIDTPGFQSIDFQEADQIFRDIKKYSEEYNLWLASFSDAVKYLKEYESAKLQSWVENGFIYIFISVECDCRFDSYYPLSVILEKNKLSKVTSLYNDISSSTVLDIIPNKLYKFRLDKLEEQENEELC